MSTSLIKFDKIKPEHLIRIKSVVVLKNFAVCLEFTDGTQKEIELEPFLHGPIFNPIRNNPLMFRSVQVYKRMGTIVWDNGADIDPDVLYYGLKPSLDGTRRGTSIKSG